MEDLHADRFVTNIPHGMAGPKEKQIRIYLSMLACRRALAGEASSKAPSAGYQIPWQACHTRHHLQFKCTSGLEPQKAGRQMADMSSFAEQWRQVRAM